MRRSELLDAVLEEFTATGVPQLPTALDPGSRNTDRSSGLEPNHGADNAIAVSFDAPVDPSFDDGLHALHHFVIGDFDAIVEPAASALRLARDPDALALARAVAGLAIAGWPDAAHDAELRDPVTAGDPLRSAADDDAALSEHLRSPLLHLLAEAALACARIDLAAAFLERAGAVPETLFGRRHPYLTIMRVLHVRVKAFQGKVSDAHALVEAAVDGASGTVESLFTAAVACLVDGNSDQRSSAKELADRIEASGIEPVSAITRGCYLLAAYGLVAVGSVGQAARFVLAAGADAGLARLMIVDRALGLELLAASAVAADDLDAAESWLAQAAPLREHPIAASTIARIDSRVALFAGHPQRAVEFAELAIRRARADDRLIEAAEGEILLARARIAASRRGEAAQRLEHVVTDAVDHGHLAVRRSASRELREVGRRLRPVASSGLLGLSAREIDVAHRVASGMTNSAIAGELFLSEHTVRIHVSRVLHAFGVATRVGVATALPPSDGSPDAPTLTLAPPLTPRQRDIVDGIVSGATNAEIARRLGIGVKTVEKHVSEILRRWDTTSRVGIARIALAARSAR